MARIAASALLLTAGLLSACHGARPAEPVAVAAAGPVRFQETPAPVAPVRVAQGVLALDGRGCLRVGAAAVLWPEEAGLDISRPGQVRIYADDGAAVRVGDTVQLSGQPAASTSDCPGQAFAAARFAPAA
jgi:hypothetical protein